MLFVRSRTLNDGRGATIRAGDVSALEGCLSQGCTNWVLSHLLGLHRSDVHAVKPRKVKLHVAMRARVPFSVTRRKGDEKAN